MLEITVLGLIEILALVLLVLSVLLWVLGKIHEVIVCLIIALLLAITIIVIGGILVVHPALYTSIPIFGKLN